jgi:hypothetical protein
MSATTPPVAVALGVIGLSSRTSSFIGREQASQPVFYLILLRRWRI